MSHRSILLSTAVLFASASAIQAAGNGLRGEYFNNNGLLGAPTLVRTDASVNFTWNSASPGTGVSADRFSARWTGQIQSGAAGAYKFATISDAGIRVWVNNALVIDHWDSHSTAKKTSAAVTLGSNQTLSLKIEYYENTGNAVARFYWTPPGQQEAQVPQANLFSTAVTTALPVPTYLSNLSPTVVHNGWGPYQRDHSNGETSGADGHTIEIGGVKFPKGLGVHALSELRYNLAGKFDTFSAFTGVDDEVLGHGSVVFQVWLDGAKAFESPVARGTDAARYVEVKTAGKQELKLMVIDAGDGNGYDHADWGDARVFNSGVVVAPVAPGAPSGLTAAPGDTKITLAWNASTGAASYTLFRTTTVANSSAIGTGQPGATVTMPGIQGTGYVDTGLANGTRYTYRVAGVNGAGMGEKSAEASAMPMPAVPPPAAPSGLSATPGDKQIALAWGAVAGATGYNLYRGTSAGGEATSPIKMNLTSTSITDTGLVNGTKYFYKVAALNAGGTGERSGEASATPAATPPLPAPGSLTAAPGNKQVDLTWAAVTGATSYNLYRGTSAGGEATTAVKMNILATSVSDTGLVNGTKYFYKVAAVNANGAGDKSAEASATPALPPPPAAPTNVTATPGDKQIVLKWSASTGADTYNVYRGTTPGGEATTALMSGLTALTLTDPNLVNGTTYFYKVAAVSVNGTSPKSAEASATPTAPGLLLTQAQKDAFRFLRQSTWGPTLPQVDHVVQVGKAAFLTEQVAAPASDYPQTLEDMPNMELVSERFFQNGIQGQDQLRQRVAWALSQIFVASATKVDNTHAMVPYIKMLHARAFDNVKNIMRDVSLSPAMGEFLDMVNNKKADGGLMPNENYAREWMQLFAIGLTMLDDSGNPIQGPNGPVPTYTQADILDMARVLTGWTYGDANAGNPTRINQPYYKGPMKPVDRYHDTGQKTVMGRLFPAGQTAQQDFDEALDMVFTHPNVGPFLSRQLIQRLVTSNPSPQYIHDVAMVFNNNGQGVRGDMNAVVRAILLHSEAASGSKFSEPALFLLTLSRALGASVVDHPFLTDFSQDMAQRIWFAPSVFNYFSPNYRAGALFAPEMQIWTTATAMIRTNFVASLVSGGFGSDVTLNLAAFNAVATDPNALADTANAVIMGGTMGPDMRGALITAIQASKGTEERVRTAIYVTAAAMQYQVEH